MRIGGSLFLIAVGAIVKFAVTDKVHGIDLPVVGVILMIVGAVVLLFELTMFASRRRTVVTRGRGVTYVSGPADSDY